LQSIQMRSNLSWSWRRYLLPKLRSIQMRSIIWDQTCLAAREIHECGFPTHSKRRRRCSPVAPLSGEAKKERRPEQPERVATTASANSSSASPRLGYPCSGSAQSRRPHPLHRAWSPYSRSGYGGPHQSCSATKSIVSLLILVSY
jgi:hypothetical protein